MYRQKYPSTSNIHDRHMNATLLPLIDNLANHRILVVGDVMLDRFVYGQVDRISPEAPIPVMRIQRELMTLGGAGNVVRNLVSLGGIVQLFGVVGTDVAGKDVTDQITATPGIFSSLVKDSLRPTTVKVRYVANGQQLLRADSEMAQPISDKMEDDILRQVREAIGTAKVIILSDYAKGVLTTRVTSEIIKLATSAGCKVLVDPKGRDFSRYNGAYMLTPNRKELAEATGSAINSIEDAETAARKLIEAHNFAGVMAKLGGDGVCLVMKGEPAQHFHTVAREIYDVSGAGDTVVATLALALAGNITPADAAQLANIAGSIVVGKVGTASVTREELTRELVHNQSIPRDQKVATPAQAAEIAERWRKQGFKVGFTNGCFDLLHPGHISSLRQARAACDKLVVGLNSDESVKRLKGENRPVQDETSRATVLAGLADVDAVVIFGEDTPYDLIKTVRPDILVKGADYTIDKVVGADLVQSWGGKVVLAQLVDGQSTTKTISKLRSV